MNIITSRFQQLQSSISASCQTLIPNRMQCPNKIERNEVTANSLMIGLRLVEFNKDINLRIKLSILQNIMAAKQQEQQQEFKLVGHYPQNIERLNSKDPARNWLKVCLVVFVVIAIIIILYFGGPSLMIEFNKHTLSSDMPKDTSLQNASSIEIPQPQDAEKLNLKATPQQVQQVQIQQIQKVSKVQQVEQVQPDRQKAIVKKKQFEISKYVWVFVQDPTKQSFFVLRCLRNIEYFADLSGFKVNIINSSNYKQFVTARISIKIQQTIRILEERMVRQPNSNLKYHINTIKKNIISLEILNQNGGILVEKNILFTENFDWIKQINKNVYVINKGSKSVQANYIAFFNIDHGSLPQKQQHKLDTNYESERYMIKFPSVQSYFLAAQRKGEYLTQAIWSYYSILENSNSLQVTIKLTELNVGVIEGKDPYSEALIIAFQKVLQNKQKELDADITKQYTYAIDYYGLFTINERYFPKKLHFIFQNNFQKKIYNNLAKYTVEQLQQTTGPLRYILSVPKQDHINYCLGQADSEGGEYRVHPHSFIAKYVFIDNLQMVTIKIIQKPIVKPQHRPWTSLPKIIWIYWDTGIQSSSLANQLCIENIRRQANASDFQFREVNNSNVEEYLGSQLSTRIQGYMSNKKIKTFPQTMSDFVRISLLAKYGGIYLDASYISVENFQWIINIANYPPQYIFNRYGKLPKVFMLFHPHYGQPFNWQFDQAANTKNMWFSAYESNLIIAEPNQQFLWDWLEEHGRFITSPYEESANLMAKYHVTEDQWTHKDNVYLAVMDAIKIVIGRKQYEIIENMKKPGYQGPKSAPEYYGIWSTSGFRGQQKIRAHTNFDNTHYKKMFNSDNPFLWRYPQSYSEGVLGKANQLIKMYGQNIWRLNDLMRQSFDSNFISEIHPESFFSKYLYNRSIGIIVKKGKQFKFVRFD